MSVPRNAESRRVYDLDRSHVFHPWSAQSTVSPMVIDRARGSYVWDGDGARYLDFVSQMVNVNIGHQHPRVVAAIQEQAARLCTIGPSYASGARAEAAQLIAGQAPEGLNKVLFTNGGADAVENAVRMARLHTGRFKVLSRYRSYHGATSLAIQLTGDSRRWPNEYANAGAVHFFGPYLYRSHFHSSTEEEETVFALDHLRQVIEFEGPTTIAAIVMETVPGTAGVLPPPPGYLRGVRQLCDQYGIVYIADEVMSGFGRTGRWFAVDHYDAPPDLLCFAKGVNSGYVPLGGVGVSDTIASGFDKQAYPGGLTYSGHPLACAAAVATISAMRDEGVIENAARIGERTVGPLLRSLADSHPLVGEVRGLGVFWVLELVKDPVSREPCAPYAGTSPLMSRLREVCLASGLLILVVQNRVYVCPPCTVTEEEVREGIEILDQALTDVEKSAW